MIIILEGTNGVGKSSYAKALAGKLNISPYRAFKGNDLNIHWGQEGEREKLLARKFHVPLNTHVDDLYVADLLSVLGASAILDRSMPSAIIYGRMYGQLSDMYTHDSIGKKLLNFWQELLVERKEDGLLYVWLKTPYHTAKERCQQRFWPLDLNKEGYTKLEKSFDFIFRNIEFDKIQINTAEIKQEDGVRRICQHLKK